MDESHYSDSFKAFGDPTRLKILTLLGKREMTVGEITTAVGLSQPSVSRHLGILKRVGAVLARRDAQCVRYRLNRDAVESCCDGFCYALRVRGKTRGRRGR